MYPRKTEFGVIARSIATLVGAILLSACATTMAAEAQESPSGQPLANSGSGAEILPIGETPIKVLNPVARNHIDLSGVWRYLPDPLREGLRKRVHPQYAFFRDQSDADNPPHRLKEYDFGSAPTINVPGSWSAQVKELTWYDGLVWYERKLDVTPRPARRYFLHFGAVNYSATVFLNGKKVGTHQGGFTPFDIDVTENLKPGENSLVIGVDAHHGKKTIPPTRTDWWNYGGITRPPMLVDVPETYLSDYWLRLSDEGRIEIDVAMVGPQASNSAVRIRIGELGIDKSLNTDDSGRAHYSFKASGSLTLWTPENPKLYDVVISANGENVRDDIGFRTIKVEGDDILLNGKPIFLRGISMHEETLGKVPDRYLGAEGAWKLLTEIKHGLNGNFVRLAHYPHAEETLRMADKMGLLVWSEIPVYWDVDFADPVVLSEARAMLRDNILRDRNRASIIIWSVANETPIREDRNRFLSQLTDDARQLDGTRLVSLASNQNRQRDGVVLINDPMSAKVDLLAVNYYGGWYGGKLENIPNVKWERELKKPLIFSEFGAGALGSFSDPEEKRFFSVDYQRDYFEATIAMAKKIPFLRGASPWVLKDFKSPRRFHPIYQEYWNRKGLLTPEGSRKPAFYTLRKWYDELAKDGPPEQ